MDDRPLNDAHFVDAVVALAGVDGSPAALAAAVRTLARWSSTDLDEAGLALLEGEEPTGRVAPADLVPPDRAPGSAPVGIAASPGGVAALLLGSCFEALLSGPERVAGAHHTPPSVADHVVGLAVGQPIPTSVCDPAVGGGVFLLAVAERLAAAGMDRRAVVACLWGFDRDPLAVAVTEAALALWSGGLDGGRPRLSVADFLLDEVVDQVRPAGGWGLIVGNPPFQSQLAARTARARNRASALRDRFGSASGGYVDEAALFALAGVGHLAEPGRLALVLPASMLAAADAAGVRASIARTAPIASIWVPETQLFAAGVDVVVPVLARGSETVAVEVTRGGPPRAVADPRRLRDGGHGGQARSVPPVGDEWAELLADAEGVPRATIGTAAGVLGDLAHVTAGFRQHFYAISAAVTDGASSHSRPVATVGAVDPLTNHWGSRSARIGGSRFLAPTIDPAAVPDDSVRIWIEARERPKVLVATQTRVVEAVADPSGTVVPSTPLISVEPTDPDRDLWPLLAVLCAPPVTAWLHRRAAGTGLSVGRVRLSAAQIRAVPLPADRAAWADAAAAIEAASAEPDPAKRRLGLVDAGRAMTEAYGLPGEVSDWWAALLPTARRPAPARGRA